MVKNNSEKLVKLGKGLSAILDDNSLGNQVERLQTQTPETDRYMLNIIDIESNPYQPRKVFDEVKLEELASSIKQHGVFTPILVRVNPNDSSKYQLIAGERRLRASKLAGLSSIPAVIAKFNDKEMMEIALVENIQREDLTPIEEAKAYQTMIEYMKLTQEEVGKKVGKSRSYIANTMRLLTLPDIIQEYVMNGVLTMGHVKPLVGLGYKETMEIAHAAIEKGLSVRDVESMVRLYEKKNTIRAVKSKKAKNPVYEKATALLKEQTGTRVKIKTGEIKIYFANDEDLQRILKALEVSK